MALRAFLVLVCGAVLTAETRDPCATKQTAADIRFTLALKRHEPLFQEGQIIPLELSFTSSTNKRYWADVRNYDRSGRLGIEHYCVEPDAPDPLESYFKFGAFIGGGLGSTQELGATPFTADAELNEWRTLKAGRYRVFAISYRVWRPPDPKEETPYKRVSEVVRSNTIEVTVKPADPAWQSEQLRAALETLGQLSALEEGRRAARTLRFLNTEESTRQLARRFIDLKQPLDWDLMFGLYGSPYRQLAIDSMRAEAPAPSRAITDAFLGTLVNLQLTSDHSWDPPPNLAQLPEDEVRRFYERHTAHMLDLTKVEIQRTLEALPHKTGSARALTLNGLLTGGRLEPSIKARVKTALIAAWNDLPVDTQRELIVSRWGLIAGPEMVPILRRKLAEPPPGRRTMDARARDEALKHLYELDRAAGRGAILRDLQNVNSEPMLETIRLLPKEAVSAVMPAVLARIELGHARDLDYQLVDAFADRSALAQVKAAFAKHVGGWGCASQAAMLRYSLRVDPDYGAVQVKTALRARRNTGCYRMLFHDLDASLPKVQRTAIEALDDPDPKMQVNAARALGNWGTPEAEEALWARLRRFHVEWANREEELRPTPVIQSPGSPPAQQRALVWAIATGVNWICPPDKLLRLEALVLTDLLHQEIEDWIKKWNQEFIMINPTWFPDGTATFWFFQYGHLGEEQFRVKVAQLPRGTRLRWQFLQGSPQPTMTRQEAVYERIRAVAEEHGIVLEKVNHP